MVPSIKWFFSLETGSNYVCSPDSPQIHYVEQTGLKLREVCLPSASIVLSPCLEFLDDQIVFLILFLAWHFDITVQASLYSFQPLVLLSFSLLWFLVWLSHLISKNFRSWVALPLEFESISNRCLIVHFIFSLSAWQSVSYFFCLSLGHDNFKWLFEYFPSNVFFFLLVCINCTKQWVLLWYFHSLTIVTFPIPLFPSSIYINLVLYVSTAQNQTKHSLYKLRFFSPMKTHVTGFNFHLVVLEFQGWDLLIVS